MMPHNVIFLGFFIRFCFGDTFDDCDDIIIPGGTDHTVICDNECQYCNVSCNGEDSCKKGKIYSGAMITNIDCNGKDSCIDSEIYIGNDDVFSEFYRNTYDEFRIYCNGENSCKVQNLDVVGSFVNGGIVDADGNGVARLQDAVVTINIGNDENFLMNCDDGCLSTTLNCDGGYCNCTGNSCDQLSINSKSPTKRPSISPTELPTKLSTLNPTTKPTIKLTDLPTKSPSFSPTKVLTISPTNIPTKLPSKLPTLNPTLTPTNKFIITGLPTLMPTSTPPTNFIQSNPPTKLPSNQPTKSPSNQPTKSPSIQPSNSISNISSTSIIRSTAPSQTPTMFPTSHPTTSPTTQPTSNSNKLSNSNSPHFLSKSHVTYILFGIGGCFICLAIICLIAISCKNNEYNKTRDRMIKANKSLNDRLLEIEPELGNNVELASPSSHKLNIINPKMRGPQNTLSPSYKHSGEHYHANSYRSTIGTINTDIGGSEGHIETNDAHLKDEELNQIISECMINETQKSPKSSNNNDKSVNNDTDGLYKQPNNGDNDDDTKGEDQGSIQTIYIMDDKNGSLHPNSILSNTKTLKKESNADIDVNSVIIFDDVTKSGNNSFDDDDEVLSLDGGVGMTIQ